MTSAVAGKPDPGKAAPTEQQLRLSRDSRRSGCASASSSSTPSSSAASRPSRPRPRASSTTCRCAWAAMCLTFYMVASAGGMVLGGFLAADPSALREDRRRRLRHRRGDRADVGFAPMPPMAVPVLFALMGVASGVAGPSRDLIVKRAAPAERDRPGLRRRLLRARHRPGGRAARLRPADGHASSVGRLARHRDRAGAADHDRVQRPPRAPHGADAGDGLTARLRRRCGAARCRSRAPRRSGRFHQFSDEKISTSL